MVLDDELEFLQAMALDDTLFFTRLFFKEQYNKKYIQGEHHKIICKKLDEVFDGTCKRLIINIAPRYGKAIDSSTPMLTKSGWKLASDVSTNDFLIGSDGNFTKVLGVYPQGVLKANEIIFNDGTKIKCCDEHLWEVETRRQKVKRIKKTSELKNNLLDADGHSRYRIPIVKPLVGLNNLLPIEPYLFGCWLGDGTTHQASFCTMDDEVIKYFSHYGISIRSSQNSGKATNYGIKGGFITKLKSLGVIGKKFIPEIYLTSNFNDRLELLKGLCDTDGTCNKKNNAISISVTNKKLEVGIKKLICSLGGTYTSYYRKNNENCNINFRIPNHQPFKLERKLQHCKEINNRTKPRRLIKEINDVGFCDMVCFSVDAKDKLFCAGNDLIVTHNTELAVKSFIAKGLALNPKSKFIHLSYSDKLALDNSEAVKEIVNLELYRKLFPYVEIKKGTDSKEKWYTTQAGGVYAAACGGQITGFGAGVVDEENAENETFSGAIIIDDPIKPEDAQYENKRTLINDRYDSTIVNRVNSRDTPIIIIMQRVHDEDLCGHVMEHYKDFEVISLPVIKADGTPLWPHKHSIEELEDLRASNEFVFDTQMMQDPRPKHGMLFPKSELRHFIPTEKMEFEATIGAIDVADEGEDYLSFPIGQLIDKDIFITDVVFENDEGVTVGLCAELIDRLIPEYVRVESNNGGNFFMQLLQAEVKGDTGLLASRNTTNKLSRIRTAAGFIKKYCVFVDPKYQSEQYKKFYDNFTKFTKNGKGVKHDDAPDSVEQLVRFIKSYYSHLYD